MALALDIASWVLLVGGGFFCIVGSMGLLRMPDAYTRMHGASVTDTMGAGLILAGLMLQSGFTLTTARLAIIALLIFFTSPVASHAIARAMNHRGVEPLLAKKEDGSSNS